MKSLRYEILHYLEDAKERGVADGDLREPGDSETPEPAAGQFPDRNHANRVSQFSSSSNGSGSSTTTSVIIHNGGSGSKDGKWTTSVEIERNDSGLGSETGGKSSVTKRPPVKFRTSNKTQEQICEDCDQVIDESESKT